MNLPKVSSEQSKACDIFNGTVSNTFSSLTANSDKGNAIGPKVLLTLSVKENAITIGHDMRSAKLKEGRTDPLTATDWKEPPLVVQYININVEEQRLDLIDEKGNQTSLPLQIVDTAIADTVLHSLSEKVFCLNDQGGKSMAISVEKVNTLRAEMHGNIPIVLAFSVNASASDNAPVLEEKTPPLRTTHRIGVVVSEEGDAEKDNNIRESIPCFDISHRSDVIRVFKESTPTLTARMGTGGHNVPLVFGICSQNSNSMKSMNPNSGIYLAETSRTLDCNGGNPACNQGGMVVLYVQQKESVELKSDKKQEAAIGENSYCIAGNTIDRKLQNGGNGKGVLEELCYTLNTIDRHAVCTVTKEQELANGKDTVGCLMANCATKLWLGNQEAFSGAYFILVNQREDVRLVRRLTPLECERLQALPDGWTLIDNKTCSDSARYKALGNGMAQVCPDWILKRLSQHLGKTG